jgi:hydrogenase maturation protease
MIRYKEVKSLSKRALVVGLGNPILGDDGIGWAVARQLADEALPTYVDVCSEALGGISLMERLVGYEQAVIVDAMHTGKYQAGSVHVYPLEALPSPHSGHLASAHDASLQEAMQMGRDLGAALPDEVWIVAVETPYVYDFSEELSQEARSAVLIAVGEVKKIFLKEISS